MLNTAFSFIIYGYLSRIIDLYFFWESKPLGWIIFSCAIISIAFDRIKINKVERRNSILEKIMIGGVLFILFIQALLYISLIKADSYKAAEHFILNDKSIKEKVGSVKSILLIPVGGASGSSSSEGNEGMADYNFIVKGENKYMDLNLIMSKSLDTDWKIDEMNN